MDSDGTKMVFGRTKDEVTKRLEMLRREERSVVRAARTRLAKASKRTPGSAS